MIDMNPNWHPFLVHFTIGLLLVSAGLFLLARAFAARKWSAELLTAARWCLWLGALATLGTVAAGFYAYFTVAHDTASHAAMTDHRNWALPTAAAFAALALWSWRKRRHDAVPNSTFLVVIALAAAALVVTGYKGGEIVYRYGLGVTALPEAEGDGHDHSHGPETSEAAEADAHSHEHASSAPEPEVGDHAAAAHSHAAPETAAATLDAFHHALEEGRGEDALALLAEDAVIFESGGVEASRAAYAGHHLGADMAFLAGMSVETQDRDVRETADLAVVTSRTRTAGSYNGEEIDLAGTETAVLVREEDGWRIVHLHWSSRAGDPAQD